ncbi:MAG: chitobiase/beta-hexosaminidase C-terminal domain-containing protein [Bacteroides sp.]|nr:chitobiase/beta-hexosaminidase C-terminal domain-containing protein [Bacteroides sp.]MCM1433188.1 chitobiase/beta-hexosaminidase C-terminal domain-containing protein [Clostridiales bacterium]
MKERIQSISKKSLSLFLALMMIVTILPYNAITAEAAKTPTVYSQLGDKVAFNYPGGSGATYSSSGCGVYAIVNAVKYLTDKKIDPHTLGNFAIKNGNRVNGGINGPKFAKDTANSKDFGEKYGFKCTKYYTFGSSKRTMKYRYWSSKENRYITQTSSLYPSSSEWDKVYDDLKTHLSNGEVAVVLVMGHNMAIVDYNSSNDTFLILDSAANKTKRLSKNSGKYQWVTADQLNYYKAPKANSSYNNQGPYIHLRSQIAFLSKVKETNYKFTSANDIPKSRTNTTNNIEGKLNTKASVQEWGYYVGLDQDSVEAHKDNGDIKTSKYVSVKSYSKNGTSMQDFNETVKGLNPGKTYYYVIRVTIDKKKYYSGTSSKKSFYGKTTDIKPDQPTLQIASTSDTDIGIGRTVNIKWSSAKNTNKYKIDVNKAGATTGGYEKTLDKNNNNYTIPGDAFRDAGTYIIKLTAMNEAGNTAAKQQLTVTVHPNVKVEFYDTESKKVILTKNNIVYGTDVEAPPIEAPEGRTFGGWDQSLKNITKNTRISTVYTPIKYAVKFVDGLTGKQLGKVQYVPYGTSAEAPTAEDHTDEGYNFTNWDQDYKNITGETTIKSVYKWYNDDYKLKSEVTSIKYEKDNKGVQGYEVSVKLTNNTNETVNGRCVAALTSQSGILLTTTESAAFTLGKYDGITRDTTNQKTVSFFIPYNEFAYILNVYTVNDYEHSGILAEPRSEEIDNSGTWSPWYEYKGEVPKKEGVDYKGKDNIRFDTKDVVSTEYSYSTRSTKTSYDTSISGWTRLDGYQSVSQGQKTNKYAYFHNGFDKGNALYKNYNGKKMKGSENDTTIVKIDSDSETGYIYWHWCEGKTASTPANHLINWTQNSTYKKFHAFESPTKKAYKGTSYNAYVFSNKNVCSYNYNWNGYKSKQDNLTAVYTQKYTTYKKLYTYEQWSPWSAWSTTRQTTNSNKKERLQTKTEKIYLYQYQPINPEAVDPVTDASFDAEHQKVSVNATIDSQYANKSATVYIYKYTQTADYTNEYIGTTTVGENGEVKLDKVYLREAPTEETGDFTIAVAVEGTNASIKIGKIEYERPKYRIEIKDVNDNTVKTIDEIVEGSAVVIPNMTNSELGIEEGFEFLYWDTPTNKVTENIIVRPVVRQKTYNVVFIDWQNHETISDTYFYGQEVKLPELEKLEGYDITWDLSDATKITQTYEDGTTVEQYVITHNAVISADYEVSQHNCDIIDPSSLGILDEEHASKITEGDVMKNETISEQVVEYGSRMDIPMEIEESPDYLFVGWINIKTHEIITDTEITEDTILIPVYEYSKTCDIPEASVKTGEYSSNQIVELTCSTANAIIYYTIDGTNPETSETAIQYTDPITLTTSCHLQFYAWAYNHNNSGVVSEIYAINTSISGKWYHIVTVYSDLLQAEDEYYQVLIKDSTLFKDDDLKNIEGYKYDGLYTDENITVPFLNESEVIGESITLYAHYIPNVYTATFNDENGNLIASVQTEYGTAVEEPAVPDKEGYVFVGWDSDDYLCITQDGTFTAKYVSEEDYATVEFIKKPNPNGYMAGTPLALNKLVKVSPAEKADAELIWTSSNPTVAEVDEEGLVTLLEPGMTTITVMVESSGETAHFEIVVTSNPDTQITLNKNSILGFDSDRNVREIPDGKNTVAELRDEFMNDELHFYGVNGNELLDADKVGTGVVIKLLDGNKVLDEVTVIMTGDYNGDGRITTLDGTFLGQYILKKREINEIQRIAMDVNNDKTVNLHDKALLSQYLVGKAELKESI